MGWDFENREGNAGLNLQGGNAVRFGLANDGGSSQNEGSRSPEQRQQVEAREKKRCERRDASDRGLALLYYFSQKSLNYPKKSHNPSFRGLFWNLSGVTLFHCNPHYFNHESGPDDRNTKPPRDSEPCSSQVPPRTTTVLLCPRTS